MKVYVLPADVYGCGHYRLIWPANVLQQLGHEITIIPPGPGSGFLAQTTEIDSQQVLTSVQIPSDADVIVIQRPAHPLQPQMIRMLRQNGIAVVVDMDDDMSNIHPDNAAYHEYHPRSTSPFSWRHALESCKAATLVTTSTRSLRAIYASHDRGIILDNYVPEAYLDFDCPVDQLKGAFGWAGSVKSHPNDLQVLGGVAQRLVDDGHQLMIVGDGAGIKTALKLREQPSCTGVVPMIDWARTVAQSFSVGIVPLAQTAFNRSKSRLKGIEMMAVGIPWISSPREEYRKLQRESGCGLLADTPKQWYEQVTALLTDKALRQDMAAAGKEWMRAQTYQAQAWRWAEAWQTAYDIERRK